MLSGSMLQETRHSVAEVEVCAYEGAEDAREGTAGATIQDHQAPPMRRRMCLKVKGSDFA